MVAEGGGGGGDEDWRCVEEVECMCGVPPGGERSRWRERGERRGVLYAT